MNNETSVARQRGAADAFRPLHFVMAFVSVGYVAILVLPIALVILCALLSLRRIGMFLCSVFPDEEMIYVAVMVAFWLSIVLNTALFSVRYYVRRDCLLPMLYAFVVLISSALVLPVQHFFYAGQETHHANIIELIAYLHFGFFLGLNIFYYDKGHPSRRKEKAMKAK